jgi:hypothetical protein
MPNRLQIFLPNMNSAGLRLVVVCDVIRYCMRNRLSLSVMSLGSFSMALKLCFIIWTTRSAWPFVAGWQGAEYLWWIPLALRKSSNSDEWKFDPLSLTRIDCKPKRENISRKILMVAVEFVGLVGMISGHLLCASTTMRRGADLRSVDNRSVFFLTLDRPI